jgi:hypothetical protein
LTTFIQPSRTLPANCRSSLPTEHNERGTNLVPLRPREPTDRNAQLLEASPVPTLLADFDQRFDPRSALVVWTNPFPDESSHQRKPCYSKCRENQSNLLLARSTAPCERSSPTEIHQDATLTTTKLSKNNKSQPSPNQ